MTPTESKLDETKEFRQWPLGRLAAKLLWRSVGFSFLLVLAASCAFAQAAAEYGSTTSGVASSLKSFNLMNKVKFPSTTNTDSSAGSKGTVIMSHPSNNPGVNPNYIYDTMTKGSVAANRKALEQRAGKNAAKLMLRSTPTDAYVKINGKPVGRTPLLLIVPPGQYKVAMDGKRMEHAERKVDLMPKETREYSLKLKQVYPTQVEIQLH